MIQLEERDGVTVVRLEHGKASLMDVEMCETITSTFTELQHAGSGAVVLTGSGHIFSAGVDLKRFVDGGSAYIDAFYPALLDCLHAVWCLDRPLVTALNGHAIAGGCILAAASDVRLMAEGKGLIGAPELTVGVPFPPLVLEILRAAVPRQHFRTIVFLGETHAPEAALRLGLVDVLAPAETLLEQAVKTARRMGRVPQVAFALNKQQVRKPVLDSLAQQTELNAACRAAWLSDAVREAVAATVERTLKR